MTLFLIVSLPLVAELLAAVVASASLVPLLKAQASYAVLVLTGVTATMLRAGHPIISTMFGSPAAPDRF